MLDLRRWRRKRADERFPVKLRTRVLQLVRRGATPADAARAVDLPVQTIHSRSRIDPAWQARLDKALMAGRRPDVPHGTPSGYRYHKCHCPECRAAHRSPAS
ncbi:hypothetical protein E1091_00160 [Micromonospora fluostatini]|uniref:Helix-turn-helix domain-containing protein n=1 Tax=Micromonospora fluostatini TaxID=1629071 RepID=A0ABY2DPH4_9ACTN|nr:hypothetical protein E1091_00160 [Micromonospora fluostatini]